MPSRRFPPPWTVEDIGAAFVVRDHNGQQLAYVYFEEEPGRRSAAIPGGIEHEGYFPEDSEVIDFFAPVREDFLTGAPPPYMTQR